MIERFGQSIKTSSSPSAAAPAGLFIYLAWHNTHTPLECPEEWSYPALPASNNSYKPRMVYNCMSRILDDGIGNVTAALRRAGLWEDAQLFFAADNGGWAGSSGASNYPLRGSKTSDFEGGGSLHTGGSL